MSLNFIAIRRLAFVFWAAIALCGCGEKKIEQPGYEPPNDKDAYGAINRSLDRNVANVDRMVDRMAAGMSQATKADALSVKGQLLEQTKEFSRQAKIIKATVAACLWERVPKDRISNPVDADDVVERAGYFCSIQVKGRCGQPGERFGLFVKREDDWHFFEAKKTWGKEEKIPTWEEANEKQRAANPSAGYYHCS